MKVDNASWLLLFVKNVGWIVVCWSWTVVSFCGVMWKKWDKNSDAEIDILVGSCFIGVQMLPAILCRSTICSGFGVGRGGFGEFPFPKTWLCFALKHFGGYVTDETCLLVREAKLRQLPYTKSHVEFRWSSVEDVEFHLWLQNKHIDTLKLRRTEIRYGSLLFGAVVSGCYRFSWWSTIA